MLNRKNIDNLYATSHIQDRYPTFDQNARKIEKDNSDFNSNWNWIRNFQL